jgi:hypothetical protein
MTTQPGPGNEFLWGSINNGQVAGNSLVAQNGSLHTNTTIDGLSPTVTLIKGQRVSGTGIPVPDFVAAGVTASASFTVITATTTTSVQAVTVDNCPVLLGGEWSATIGTGAALTSSYWNNTGITRQSDTGSALMGDVFFLSGGTMTPPVGGSISGWFLKSYDGGVTFETAIATPSTLVAAMARAPDFIIPLDNAAYALGNIKQANGQVNLPSVPFKTLIQANNGTIALPANSAIILVPEAVVY